MLILILQHQSGLIYEIAPGIRKDRHLVYEGYLTASVCAVASGYLIQKLTLRQSLVPLVALAAGSAATALALAYVQKLKTAFILSALFQCITEAGCVMASVVLARQASKRDYALILGINTFISVGIQIVAPIILFYTGERYPRNFMFAFAAALVAALCAIMVEIALYTWTSSLIEQRYEPLLPPPDQKCPIVDNQV